MTTALATPAERNPRFALGQSIGLAATVRGYPLVEMMHTCRLQTQSRDSSEAAWGGAGRPLAACAARRNGL